MISNFKKLFSYRELLVSLTKKELKVKYRGSILGFFWSLLNPILIMLNIRIFFKYQIFDTIKILSNCNKCITRFIFYFIIK